MVETIQLKIFYNDDYLNDDFLSKFENEKIEKILVYSSRREDDIQETLNSIRPLDIVKIFKGRKKARTKKFSYTVHAGIYLGKDEEEKHKFCHANSANWIEICNWEIFSCKTSPVTKIICYRPVTIFKNREKIIKHIAKCIIGEVNGRKRYFDNDYFGEFYLGLSRETQKETNNCECFANRCVLGLDFSELFFHRRKEEEPDNNRGGILMFIETVEFNNAEINEIERKLDSLATDEEVNNKINEINNYQANIEQQ